MLYSHSEGKDAIIRVVAVVPPHHLASDCMTRGWMSISHSWRCAQYAGLIGISAIERPAMSSFRVAYRREVCQQRYTVTLEAAFRKLADVLELFNPCPALWSEVTLAALHGLPILRLDKRHYFEGREARLDLLVGLKINRSNGPG